MAKKPHIAIILPDRIEHPIGYKGIQTKALIDHLKNDFEFSVHGFADRTVIPYYHNVFEALPNTLHSGLDILTRQTAYLASIMEMVEKGIKPDLLHAVDHRGYLSGIYASKILNIPLVVSMPLSARLMNQIGFSNAFDMRSQDGSLIDTAIREIELLGLQAAKRIIHVSTTYKKLFSQTPGLDEKSVFIPNGIDLKDFEISSLELSKISLPGNNKRKVLYLGRFVPQKNLATLLHAQIPQEIDLIIAGESAENPSTRNMLKERMAKNNNVYYIGPIFNKEKIAYLKLADAVIIPSVHESQPLVMFEAMASGSVILHSGAGDMSEILTNDFAINCGITTENISQALQRVATMNEEEMAARKARGLEVVKEYTWEKTAEKTKEVYLSLIKK